MANFLPYAALAACMSNFVSAWNVGQLVNTTSGPLIGHASLRHKEVSEYLGNLLRDVVLMI
jgi:hypothetical protein